MSVPELLTARRVRELLDAHGLAPTKRLGQNFMVDANTVRKIVRDAGVGPGDRVVEVGPGLGSLTLALRAAGALVTAIEVDAGLVRALRDVVGEDPGVTVVHGDALRVDLGALAPGAATAAADDRPPRLVANLPYNVATPVVMHALAAGAFDQVFVLVQREVGQRWVAGVGDPLYGAVSVKIAAQAAARLVATVARGAFRPVPNVDSATVELRRRPVDLPVALDELFPVVEAGFAQRRKRLRNALAGPGRAPAAVEASLARAGLDPGARAEELDLAAFAALAAALGPHDPGWTSPVIGGRRRPLA